MLSLPVKEETAAAAGVTYSGTGLEVLVEASVTCTSLVPSEETSLAGTDTTTAVSDQEVMWTPPAPLEVSEPRDRSLGAPEVLPVDGQGEGAGRRN